MNAIRAFGAGQKLREGTLSAQIIRADGRVEDLGIIGYHSSNPLKMLTWNIKQWFKRITA